MLFLSGTAFCSSDSYDPNPYDDIPPVVTVEFNYVVPGQMSHAIVRTALTRGGLHPVGYIDTYRVPMLVVELNPDQVLPPFLSVTPEISAPLRR
jgi:hypothetical protein